MCLTGSVASVRAAVGLSHYVAAKHGVVGLMRSLAPEWAPRGIRVNAVLPSGRYSDGADGGVLRRRPA